MDKRLPLSRKKSAQPVKVMAILAVFVALFLCYAMIKTFSHSNKSNYAKNKLSLPELDDQDINGEDETQENVWKTIITQSGDSLAILFKRVGISPQTLQTILKNNPQAKLLTSIRPNQSIRFLIQNSILEKMIIPIDTARFLMVTRTSSGYMTQIETHQMDTQQQYVTATISGSLFGTAKRLNIPYKLINQMTEIFNWEIDFSKDVRTGDQFSIVYKAFYIADKQVATGEILAVRFTNKGKTYQAIRHHNNNGEDDYFTPEGTSLKKAFSRYPIKFSHISSTFTTARFHPILHYKRAHKGVDLAAPIGTPIHATGDGTIVMIDRNNAYGNMIKIAHNKTFASIYAHMLRFQKGLSRGNHVKRGQIIGYVGQSGLATGPHCHYEFHVNQQAKNPSTIELPRGAPISGSELIAFKAQTGTLLAQLKLVEDAQLASNPKKISHG